MHARIPLRQNSCGLNQLQFQNQFQLVMRLSKSKCTHTFRQELFPQVDCFPIYLQEMFTNARIPSLAPKLPWAESGVIPTCGRPIIAGTESNLQVVRPLCVCPRQRIPALPSAPHRPSASFTRSRSTKRERRQAPTHS